jgi:hypothetical protein
MEMHLRQNVEPIRVLDARPVRLRERQARNVDHVRSL